MMAGNFPCLELPDYLRLSHFFEDSRNFPFFPKLGRCSVVQDVLGGGDFPENPQSVRKEGWDLKFEISDLG
jgi:hypothetical protein